MKTFDYYINIKIYKHENQLLANYSVNSAHYTTLDHSQSSGKTIMTATGVKLKAIISQLIRIAEGSVLSDKDTTCNYSFNVSERTSDDLENEAFTPIFSIKRTDILSESAISDFKVLSSYLEDFELGSQKVPSVFQDTSAELLMSQLDSKIQETEDAKISEPLRKLYDELEHVCEDENQILKTIHTDVLKNVLYLLEDPSNQDRKQLFKDFVERTSAKPTLLPTGIILALTAICVSIMAIASAGVIPTVVVAAVGLSASIYAFWRQPSPPSDLNPVINANLANLSSM